MQDKSQYTVGIDIGTTTVRCVVGFLDETSTMPTIVGVGKANNGGMRKGMVVKLEPPSKAIDEALGEAERMSGFSVERATLGINGSHILSTKTDGMIAVGTLDHVIDEEDIIRVEDVAVIGKIPANREIITVVPHSYRLDGQDNIKDPVGMTGTRLELSANVVSALVPHVDNISKVAANNNITPNGIIASGVAAATAVLTESQIDNGVALVDIGGATTSVVVYEDGVLQHVSVIPLGGINITNDLAIGLKVDPDVAEKVKLKYASAVKPSSNDDVSMKIDGGGTCRFSKNEIFEIIEARLEEIFELVQKELKKIDRNGKLPGGVVLTGGTSNIKGIVTAAKENLGLAVKLGKPKGFGGVAEDVEGPEFATAIGLMLSGLDGGSSGARVGQGSSKGDHKSGKVKGFFQGIFKRIKP